MGVILQVALPSRVLAAARLQCGAAGAGASRGLGVCAEHARLAARGESARAMEIGDFLVWLGPVANSQCETRITGSKLYLPCEPYDPDRVTGCPVPGWPCAYAAGLSHTTIYRIHAFWGVVGGGGDADGRAGAL